MRKPFQNFLYLFLILPTALVQMAHAELSCPSDGIKPFAGQWRGKAVLTPANGGSPVESGTLDIFKIDDCDTFSVTVNYLDSSGNVARVLQFKATHRNESTQGIFDIDGNITEGVSHSPMTGTIQNPQVGILLGHFLGAIGGQNAFLSEVMKLSGNQLTRTIQMHAGNASGPYLGTRVVQDVRVQP